MCYFQVLSSVGLFFHLFLGRWISCFLIGWYSLVDSCSRRNERNASAFIVQQAVLKRKPWVPEDLFFLTILMVRGEAASRRREAPRQKNNLWSQELGVAFPCNFRIIYLIKPVWSWYACLFSLTLTAGIWSYMTLRLRCMKKELRESLLRKESAIRKKRKNLLHPGYYPWEYRTEPSKTKHSRKSSYSFKVRPLVGKIQTKLRPRATFIQSSNVRVNNFEV